MSTRPPIAALIGEARVLDDMPYHCFGDKYAAAIRSHAGAMPVGVMPPASEADLAAMVDAFDGFVFTGSASNVHPALYHEEPDADPGSFGPFDPDRDRFALPLIRLVLARKRPCLFICRGLQELNVALGGTLRPETVLPGQPVIHHPDPQASCEARYRPAHTVSLRPGSPLIEVFGQHSFKVNSLHYQAIDRIAPGLVVHGLAEDGLPEVVAVDECPFAVGVQWHPEYRPDLHPANRSLLAAFGAAMRAPG